MWKLYNKYFKIIWIFILFKMRQKDESFISCDKQIMCIFFKTALYIKSANWEEEKNMH